MRIVAWDIAGAFLLVLLSAGDAKRFTPASYEKEVPRVIENFSRAEKALYILYSE